jgi:Domain of unknown function (DUF6456)
MTQIAARTKQEYTAATTIAPLVVPPIAPRVVPAAGPHGTSKPLSARAMRLLRHLGEMGALARPSTLEDDMVALFRVRGGVTLGAGQVKQAEARALTEAGLARWTPKPDIRLVLTGAGESLLQKQAIGAAIVASAEGTLRPEQRGGNTVVVNTAESPLAWLHRRKGPDGKPLIDAAAFAAGERLRQDMTRAGSLPSVSANWSASVAQVARGPERLNTSEAMMAARQRVDLAMRAVGPEMSGLLLDVCGFLKGLEQVERERGWPARSAKLILAMALARLAAHYGIAGEAVGLARQGQRAWRAQDGRPQMMGGDQPGPGGAAR